MTEDEAIDLTRDLFLVLLNHVEDIVAEPGSIMDAMDEQFELIKERFVETSDNS